MTPATVRFVDMCQEEGMARPLGTAIVRPLRHVQAVRDRHAQRFTDPAEAEESRSVRAWAWTLGESAIAPVTDRATALPPSRADIEIEIAAADERRAREDQEGRADATARILRWLIGEDDHVPVRGENRGELVGGFGDVVRSRDQIANLLAQATDRQRLAAAHARDLKLEPSERQSAQQDTDYLGGVIATLAWVLDQRPAAPITRRHCHELTTKNLKSERVHAEDVIEQAKRPWIADQLPPPWYGEGVKNTISWLLGDRTTSPVDPAGRGSLHIQILRSYE